MVDACVSDVFPCEQRLRQRGRSGWFLGSWEAPARGEYHHWPSSLLEVMGPPWEPSRMNLLLYRQLSLRGV